MKVRELLPVRRPVTTKSPKEDNWTQHKPDLREDFHSHCGYCGSYDGYRHTWYEVDHFIPKSLLDGNISNVEYSNLVYSCKFCNNKKLAKWPTDDITIPNANNKGFVDPCDEKFDSHLYRMGDGSIMWNTQLGKWMWESAFKFDERNYAIRLLWEVNQLRQLVFDFAKELSKIDENSEQYQLINKKVGELSFKYVLVHNDLMNHYNS
jgi:hypothetical protein